jgi:CHAD domain-containing protein
MKANTELEWQFSAAQLHPARAWLAAQPSDPGERRLAARPTLELTDTYYDSPDWMIFRAGFALRVRCERAGDSGREETEVTLKSLHDPRGGLARRKEVSQRVDDANIETVLASESGIGERVRELIGTRPLNELFKANTRRERRHLLEADTDLPLAEVDLDETSIETPSGATCQLKRVEVECLNATPAALEPFVEQLREAAQLQPIEQSKFRAGLNTAGLDPARGSAPPDTAITATQPFAATQFALLRKYFTAVIDNEPRVRAGSVQAVHEMRVAARHLDVLLRLFTGFGPRWAVGSRTALRALIDALGAVRDCDVQLAFLQESGEPVEPLRLRVDRQRNRARARLLRMLDSSRIRGWADHWAEQLELATGSSARARKETTAVVAQSLIRSAARKLRKHADRLDEQSSADDYHKVRIRAKRLRYALDAFGELYGDAAREYLDALAKLQNLLGEFHESAVRSERFTELVTSGRRVPASTSFVVGRWVERDQRAFDHCRRKFPKLYRRTQRRRWRNLLEAMRQQTESLEQS